VWTKHLKDEDRRKDFESLLRNTVTVLSRLREIINEKEASLLKEEAARETYSAGYPYLQAHLNGRKAELKELRELLSFIPD
jgi:hypothetical protein